MNSAPRRVVVTGLGIVSPIGNSVPVFFSSLIGGHSGIQPLPYRSDIVAGTVDFSPEAHFSRVQLLSLDRFAQFALVATEQALRDAKLDGERLSRARSGVYFGSGIGGANAIETGYRSFLESKRGRVPPLTVVSTMTNAAAAQISLRYGILGPCMTYSVACASSAIAIGEACRAIRDGYLDVAITGGAEALLTPAIIAAWHSMKVLATPAAGQPEKTCRPFSRDRSGLVLGEGAAVVVLETLASAEKRGCNVYAELIGYGQSCDAHHLTTPSVAGQAAAMRDALADAKLEPSDIGYINAHGTATQVGDVTETAAIKKVFGNDAYQVPVSSTKALHGHLLGAAGALELTASILALSSGSIPPTCHYTEPDGECDLDYVPNEARTDIELNAVMSNSFAFGGTNAVLIARKL